MKNLFGEDQPEYKKPIGKYQVFRARNNYRKATTGQKCENCKFIKGFEGHRQNYYKCLLQGVGASLNSDIRLSYICDKHEERK